MVTGQFTFAVSAVSPVAGPGFPLAGFSAMGWFLFWRLASGGFPREPAFSTNSHAIVNSVKSLRAVRSWSVEHDCDMHVI